MHLSRLSTILIVVVTVYFPSAACAKGKTVKLPFSLSLIAENVTVKTGSPVWVNVMLKNKSKGNISVYREGAVDQGGFVYKAEIRMRKK
jgi:hypothetical protein